MTLIPSKRKIASAIIITAVIAAGSVPSLRAQSILPAQGGFDSGDFGPPPSGDQDDSPMQNPALPSALASDNTPMDDMAAEQQAPLIGSIDGKDYVAPTGAYRIRIPVYPELGGQITDMLNVATFEDAFGEHYSIGCFPVNNDLRIEEAKRGRKDFLIWFFQNYIQADFLRNLPGTTAMPNARYNASTQGGTLFTQLLIPNGSVYEDRVFVFPPKEPIVAKRGNLVFERDGFVYVLSTELSERVFEHGTWNKTDSEEEEILRGRLNDLLARMVFTKPQADATPSAPAPALMPPPSASLPAPAPADSTSSLPTVSFPSPTTGTGANVK